MTEKNNREVRASYPRRYRAQFGENLKKKLKERRISQATLAKEIGVSRTCVGFWCNGHTIPPAMNGWNSWHVFWKRVRGACWDVHWTAGNWMIFGQIGSPECNAKNSPCFMGQRPRKKENVI